METRICRDCGQEKGIKDFYLINKVYKNRNYSYPRPECKECSRAEHQLWKKENKEKHLAYNKLWAQENRERVNAASRKYYQKNIEYERSRTHGDPEKAKARHSGYSKNLHPVFLTRLIRQRHSELRSVPIPVDILEIEKKRMLSQRILRAFITKDTEQLIKLSSLTKGEFQNDTAGKN